MIYLASPYSHPDEKVREERYFKAMEAIVCLFERAHVISPIVHCHPMAVKYSLPGDDEFWRRYDEDLISHSDGIIVLCLDGWRESIGVTREIAFAKKIGKPVEYLQNYIVGPGWSLISPNQPNWGGTF